MLSKLVPNPFVFMQYNMFNLNLCDHSPTLYTCLLPRNCTSEWVNSRLGMSVTTKDGSGRQSVTGS